ncbi:MAG: hypothetical protein ABL986_06570 [Vicinamibacterales bacterium]
MRILFFCRHYAYLRLFEAPIAALAERGHEVRLVADREESMGGRGLAERLASRYPNVTLDVTPGRAPGLWGEFARRLRLGIDYLRYLDPRYASTPHLTARARERAPRLIVRVAEKFRAAAQRQRLGAILRSIERSLPRARHLEAYIREQRPDLVLITPLVELGSPQMEHMAAAKAVGVRTMLPIASWDHLSSKALLRNLPDSIVVWNPVQKSEAIEMHGVPESLVTVTGAQCYDQWFGRQPSRTREQFSSRTGIRSDRPYLLYLCSSLFRGTANEALFVERWVAAVRASADPRLKDIGILIRPHPQRLQEWKSVDLSGYRNLAFWGAHPVDDEAKDDYFDSMYYAAGVVGLNTSAFLEAAAVGKPVHTILDDQISVHNQEGTIHFHYLTTVGGGLLRVARSFDDHLEQVASTLAGDGGGDSKAAAFVQGFIRPFGLDVAATPKFAEVVERVAAMPPPAPVTASVLDLAWRIPAYPLAGVLQALLATQPWRKDIRRTWRKRLMDGRRRFFVEIKQFAQSQLVEKDKEREVAPAAPQAPGTPSALTPKLGRQRDPAKKPVGWDLPEAEDAREFITMLGRSGRPIILGPWLSETGFELLYWIPFLAWAKTYGNFDPAQLTVISRGGASSWYSHITPNYEDIFSIYTPDQFRQANDARINEQEGRLKHLGISSFDQTIIDKVVAKRGIKAPLVLHPSLMYRVFTLFWFQKTSLALLESFTSFSALPSLELGPLRAHLPDRYVAAKFYGNTALPETPENRAFAASYLEELTQHTDVVLLNTGHRFDDHEDMPRVNRARLHSIDHLMTPETNLDVQTRVIAGAQAFVGTYGGFSYLAPFVGTDTLAFYSHVNGFRFDHLEVAKRVFAALKLGAFVELDLRAIDLIRLGFGGSTGEVMAALAGSAAKSSRGPSSN